jgi:hypothetical protein
MEVAYANGVDPQSPADRVSGPRAKRGSQEGDHYPSISSPPDGYEQRGVKATDQQGENWSRTYVHAPSIRTQAIDRTVKRSRGDPGRS